MSDESIHVNECDENTPLLQVNYSPFSDKSERKSLVSVKQLFRFCDRTDAILLVLAVFGSIIYGIITPAQFLLFGKLVDEFTKYIIYKNEDLPNGTDLENSTSMIAVCYVMLAVGNFLFAWMGMGLFALSAERQVHKMRLVMFRNAIYQEIGWFDEHSSGELNTRFTEDLRMIADGIGSKLGRLISSVVSFLVGYVIGFMFVWELTFMLLAVFPPLIIAGGVMTKVTGSYAKQELKAYSRAGKVAEQSISSLRTVSAFGGEERQAELYGKHVDEACKFGIKKGISIGLGMGVFQLILYSNFALSVWYILKLARDDKATPGKAIAVFFAISMGSLILGQGITCVQALAVARGSAYTVFNIIDRESKIDASSNTGLKPSLIKGDLEFSHVDFAYPARPSVKILDDFSLKVSSGKRVAVVGESGAGKSTIVKLIQRFYDPLKGSVLLDGQDIKSLNVRHLRSLIGVVNQEPVLFATTIAENIAYGRERVTQQEIEEAAKMANTHDFIIQFPQGYNTLCGERGAKMSGGQKQRIAIARALVRNPKILLLDEATSALDSESEAVVQVALNKASEGRTTIVVAHSISSVKNCDIIVAVKEGQVAEIGTDEELMALDGVYSAMVNSQMSCGKDDDVEQEQDEDSSWEVCSGDSTTLKVTTVSSIMSEYQNRILQHDEDDEDVQPVSFPKILKLNSPEWKFLVIGCLGAAFYGCFPLLYGIGFGQMIHTLSYNPRIKEENEAMEHDAKENSIFFFFIGVESGLGMFLQSWCFAMAGEALTKRLRKSALLAFLRQDVSYFDSPNHGTGDVCSTLAIEVSSIQGATGGQLGLFVATGVNIVGSLTVSFICSWKLTLLMMAFVPFLILAGMLMSYFLGGNDTNTSVNAAAETLSSIQTVVSFGQEEKFFERYREASLAPHRKAKKLSHFVGLATGSFMAIINLSFAAAFRFGGHLVSDGDVTIRNMMISIFTVVLSAIVVGQAVSVTPDYAIAKRAAERIFHLLEKVPLIDSYSNGGKTPDKCNGEIRLSNVHFRYCARPRSKVLRNFSIRVKPGQTVALVGTSGSGKSTAVSLIERFYDANSGSVMVDGNDVKELNLRWLRSHIGVVSQEPVLFDLSIRDNIAFGDTTRNFSDKEIEEAARSANIHQFISSLPKGYDTVVGDKGTLISGGQKQRVAIARALIRDPKILLLDEATSALDTESEKVVQQALDKASIGRTTLVIAHRLSTVQHADFIVVIKKGKVVEQGTHQQLLTLNGVYSALYKQSISCSL